MKSVIENMKNHTDCWPWYWISYGEKEYGFAVVEAYPANEGDPIPTPGSQLVMYDNPDGVIKFKGNNGTKMIIEQTISTVEHQNGDTVCRFIAKAHAHLMGDAIL